MKLGRQRPRRFLIRGGESQFPPAVVWSRSDDRPRRSWPQPFRNFCGIRAAPTSRHELSWLCGRQLSKLYAIATAALWAARDDDDGRSRIASAFAISRCRWVG